MVVASWQSDRTSKMSLTVPDRPNIFLFSLPLLASIMILVKLYLNATSKCCRRCSYGRVTETPWQRPPSLEHSMKSLSVPKLLLHKYLRVSATYTPTEITQNPSGIIPKCPRRGLKRKERVTVCHDPPKSCDMFRGVIRCSLAHNTHSTLTRLTMLSRSSLGRKFESAGID